MYPTLNEKDILLIDRWSITTHQEIKRGEMVIFDAVDEPASIYEGEPIAKYNKSNIFTKFINLFNDDKKETYVKRVVGVAGDEIEIYKGQVYVNGEYFEELSKEEHYTGITGEFCNLTVPEGTIYVLGDNRGGSTDSRNFGCIPIEKIEGKVLIRLLPITNFGTIETK